MIHTPEGTLVFVNLDDPKKELMDYRLVNFLLPLKTIFNLKIFTNYECSIS